MTEPRHHLPKLRNSILSAPIVQHGTKFDIYPPFGSLNIDPEVVCEIVDELLRVCNPKNCTKLVAIESMGLPVTVVFSLRTGIPYVIARKRSYGFKNEVNISQLTGYTRATYFLNGVGNNDRVMLIDDIINTGETISAIATGIRSTGASITEIVAILDKGNSREEVERKLGIKIKTLLKVRIEQGRVKILN